MRNAVEELSQIVVSVVAANPLLILVVGFLLLLYLPLTALHGTRVFVDISAVVVHHLREESVGLKKAIGRLWDALTKSPPKDKP